MSVVLIHLVFVSLYDFILSLSTLNASYFLIKKPVIKFT